MKFLFKIYCKEINKFLIKKKKESNNNRVYFESKYF